MLKKGVSLSELYEKEFIITNGLGGWCSSTICNLNTRRYHSLLTASFSPPGERYVMVNKVDEEIIIEQKKTYQISTNQYDIVVPEGYKYLKEFSYKILPEAVYEVKDNDLKVTIKKKFCMVQHENITIIKYTINSNKKVTIKLIPLVNCRSIFDLSRKYKHDIIQHPGGINQKTFTKISFWQGSPKLLLGSDKLSYTEKPDWYYNFNYQKDRDRGYDYCEDCFSPGYFEKTFEKGENHFYLMLIADKTCEKIEKKYYQYIIFLDKLIDKEEKRRKLLIKEFYDNHKRIKKSDFIDKLVLAGDSFIVKRVDKNNGLTKDAILAGYHWFGEYGRDTMISLRGLCLLSNKQETAKHIFETYLNNIKNGLVPKSFSESSIPYYDSMDSTLWMFIALFDYYQKTKDKAFIEKIINKLNNVIDWQIKGTLKGIRLNKFGFIESNELENLTWMDAKINNIPVTPRVGAPVEIQALWYNALRIMEFFCHLTKNSFCYKKQLHHIKNNFSKYFWNTKDCCLYDFVKFNFDEHKKFLTIEKDSSIRPNQLFVIALPFRLLPKDKEIAVLKKIEKELLTSLGLRTLSKNNPSYQPFYKGNEIERNHQYHNGTIWPYLIGFYVEASLKLKKTTPNRARLRKLILNFKRIMQDYTIGTLPEIFDPTTLKPEGCISQAWSVAEILRSMVLINEYF